jgi:hypothetical protein
MTRNGGGRGFKSVVPATDTQVLRNVWQKETAPDVASLRGILTFSPVYLKSCLACRGGEAALQGFRRACCRDISRSASNRPPLIAFLTIIVIRAMIPNSVSLSFFIHILALFLFCFTDLIPLQIPDSPLSFVFCIFFASSAASLGTGPIEGPTAVPSPADYGWLICLLLPGSSLSAGSRCGLLRVGVREST